MQGSAACVQHCRTLARPTSRTYRARQGSHPSQHSTVAKAGSCVRACFHRASGEIAPGTPGRERCRPARAAARRQRAKFAHGESSGAPVLASPCIRHETGAPSLRGRGCNQSVVALFATPEHGGRAGKTEVPVHLARGLARRGTRWRRDHLAEDQRRLGRPTQPSSRRWSGERRTPRRKAGPVPGHSIVSSTGGRRVPVTSSPRRDTASSGHRNQVSVGVRRSSSPA